MDAHAAQSGGSTQARTGQGSPGGTLDPDPPGLPDQAPALQELLQLGLANTGEALVVYRAADRVVVWASSTLEQVTGIRAADVLGRELGLFEPIEAPAADLWPPQSVGTQREISRRRSRIQRPDGNWTWLEVTSRVLLDAAGSVSLVVATLRDVNHEVAATQELAAARDRYQMLAENSSDVVYLVGLDAVIKWISPSVLQVLGYGPAELVGTYAGTLVHPDDVAAAERARRDAVAQRQRLSASLRMRFRHKDGSYRWMAMRGHVARDRDGNPVGGVTALRDIHGEVTAEQALARSENLFRSAMANAPIGMAVLDLDLRFLQVNPALSDMLGRDAQWLTGHGMADLTDTDSAQVDAMLRESVRQVGAGSVRQELRLRRADGEPIWVEQSVGLVRDDDGNPVSYVSQFVDVTEVRRARERLEFLSDHDPLTALPNRRWLTDRLTRMMAHPPRGQTELGLLFCDMDGLKEINDTLGHPAGDEMIIAVAARLRTALREGDFIARIGGDEFVIVLPWLPKPRDSALAGLDLVAEKVRAAVDADVETPAGTVHPTLSVGGTLAQPWEEPRAILARADQCLYQAKAKGGNCVVCESGSGEPGPALT